MSEKNINISEYDLYNYDYEEYWKQNRSYENESDKSAIKTLLKQESGDWYIDLGGSYGRLVPTYKSKYLHCVLSDYSIEALKKARKYLKDSRIENFDFVAANVYNLPFKENTFNGGQMIRVMHHLEEPKEALKEISRIIKNKGFFILEFANKIHFLAKLRAIFTLKLGFIFDKNPYKQPNKETSQGTLGKETLFYNFHPKQIKEISEEVGFKVEKKLSVSNLRSGIFKKMFSTKVLLNLEKFLQRFLSFTNFGPSQYRKLRKKEGSKNVFAKGIYEIICCPKCKSDLIKKDSNLICKNCKEVFPISYGILDLRWPIPAKS